MRQDEGSTPTEWGSAPITRSQASEFARQVASSLLEQGVIVKNLLEFPRDIQVRGVFFDGLCRIVADARGEEALASLQRTAGVPPRLIAFNQYMHRDFYKLYYHAARLLHPGEPLRTSLHLVARTFFPIFRSSFLGKTMAALMGAKPRTILPLLAKAYNISVEGNEHSVTLEGDQSVVWRCSVEPVEWYEETFRGIVLGSMPASIAESVSIKTVERSTERSSDPSQQGINPSPRATYTFAIRW